jgi:iron complex outermembrane receptor protein
MIREITINFKDKNMKKGNFMFKVLLMLIAGIFLSIDAFAQQITVKGIVKDTTGEPVIGANVVVKGTTTGTITDFDGLWRLRTVVRGAGSLNLIFTLNF